MIDDTATEIVSDPDKFRAYLDTQARMDRYSAANALLIYKQQPQATQLKDFRDWQEDGVKVNKSKIGTTEYSIPNAAYGEYTVTAVDLSSESSESNKVVYSETTDITLPTTTRATDGKVYSIDGRQVSGNARTEGLQKGVYVTNGKKVIVK